MTHKSYSIPVLAMIDEEETDDFAEGEGEDEDLGEIQCDWSDPSITLMEDQAYVQDPDALDPEAEIGSGVIAVQYRAGTLWYMTSRDRKWVNVEATPKHGKVASIK